MAPPKPKVKTSPPNYKPNEVFHLNGWQIPAMRIQNKDGSFKPTKYTIAFQCPICPSKSDAMTSLDRIVSHYIGVTHQKNAFDLETQARIHRLGKEKEFGVEPGTFKEAAELYMFYWAWEHFNSLKDLAMTRAAKGKPAVYEEMQLMQRFDARDSTGKERHLQAISIDPVGYGITTGTPNLEKTSIPATQQEFQPGWASTPSKRMRDDANVCDEVEARKSKSQKLIRPIDTMSERLKSAQPDLIRPKQTFTREKQNTVECENPEDILSSESSIDMTHFSKIGKMSKQPQESNAVVRSATHASRIGPTNPLIAGTLPGLHQFRHSKPFGGIQFGRPSIQKALYTNRGNVETSNKYGEKSAGIRKDDSRGLGSTPPGSRSVDSDKDARGSSDHGYQGISLFHARSRSIPGSEGRENIRPVYPQAPPGIGYEFQHGSNKIT